MSQKGRPVTYDHLRSKKKPVTKSVTLCFDADLQQEFEMLKIHVDTARDGARARGTDSASQRVLDDLLAQMETMRERVAEASITFTFRSIGRKPWDDLVGEHPPTKDQVDKAKREGLGVPNVNQDSFPVAAIAASVVEPTLTVDDVKDMWDSPDWSDGELTILYQAALMVNQQARVVDLGKG